MDPFMIPTDPTTINGWEIHVFQGENGTGVRAYGIGTRHSSQKQIDAGMGKWENINVAQINMDSPMDEASTVHAVAELQREARERREKEGRRP